MGRTDREERHSGEESRSARGRNRMEHQIDATRERILDVAERLFLDNGLEATSMVDIATAADITKVTLYRYFPDRHPIAFAVAGRMLRKIDEAAKPDDARALALPAFAKEYFLRMIRTFPECREAYRYLGLFDQLYALGYPDEALAERYRHELAKGVAAVFQNRPGEGMNSPAAPIVVTILNVINGFLQKTASRGRLIGPEQGVDMETQLAIFESMLSIVVDEEIAPFLSDRR